MALLTPRYFVIYVLENPASNISIMSSSFPVSLYFVAVLPSGRPSFTPSAFFLLSASVVLWESSERSISAEMLNANARTLLERSSPSLYPSLTV